MALSGKGGTAVFDRAQLVRLEDYQSCALMALTLAQLGRRNEAQQADQLALEIPAALIGPVQSSNSPRSYREFAARIVPRPVATVGFAKRRCSLNI